MSAQFSDPRVPSAIDFSKKLDPVLCQLWDNVVKPVVVRLAVCAQLHSSALYRFMQQGLSSNEKNLPDIYVSSYTSTLCALVEAGAGTEPPHRASESSAASRGTARRNAPPPGCGRVDSLIGKEATKDKVIPGLRENSWVQFCVPRSQRHSLSIHCSSFTGANVSRSLIS